MKKIKPLKKMTEIKMTTLKQNPAARKFKNGDIVRISESFYNEHTEKYRAVYEGNFYTILGEQIELPDFVTRSIYEQDNTPGYVKSSGIYRTDHYFLQNEDGVPLPYTFHPEDLILDK